MYIKKPEYIAGDGQVCLLCVNILPLARTNIWCLGRKAFLSQKSIYRAPGRLYQRPALSWSRTDALLNP